MDDIIWLRDIDDDAIDLVGGKALGLAALHRAGEQVPDGFCLTTTAHHRDEVSHQALLTAYRQLGGGPVAVRSSATAEDLPDASFAGQQETVLDVRGETELIAAVHTCWQSLDTARARSYREARGHADQPAAMAVVVQRMVEAATAGVAFTANPLTGTRTEVVIDAVEGLGTGVVDGSVDADHLVIGDGQEPFEQGCLSAAQVAQLRQTGRRVEDSLGGPQDLEWAFDAEGTLWLLQARAITTLFPLPAGADGEDLHVYLEVGHLQGMRRPVTPMGMSIFQHILAEWLESVDIPGHIGMVDIAGRMFMDITAMIRNPRARTRISSAVGLYGPGVAGAVIKLMDDPRLAPRRTKAVNIARVLRVTARMAPVLIAGATRALIDPAGTRRRVQRIAQRVAVRRRPEPATAADRIEVAAAYQVPVLGGALMRLLPPLYAGLAAPRIAAALLGPTAEDGEIDATQRGMPHNVTTQMDLELWQVAVSAAPHRDLLLNTPAEFLAGQYRRGELPDFGLTEFLSRYGHRGATEIDVGMPRWSEDPTALFAALAGYLRSQASDQAPDVRFTRAAEEAERTIDELVGRAMRARPLRARIAGFLLRRSRELAGLRELPKFVWLHPLAEVRRQLLAAGTALTEHGRLSEPGDIMFLTLGEARATAHGDDVRALVGRRRAEYLREVRRSRVPGLVLSDGTMPENLPDETDPGDEHTMVGMPAAAGVITGAVRVVHDPASARVEPGDILVAATTDPAWTPLFLTAGALVTETGSPMAHGPTVAREYGIPAVICLPEATTRLTDGQKVTVDGNSGVVRLEPAAPPDRP